MGSPIVANIFMRSFESVALESLHLKPRPQFRYVEDTFIIWPHGRNILDSLLGHLNSQHFDIKFTVEVEENDVISSLNFFVIRKPNGCLGHSIYQKPAHTHRYLRADSDHYPAENTSGKFLGMSSSFYF
ncbi:hypothetical protein Trydic_g20684 [Trypoxylus dichotomus]